MRKIIPVLLLVVLLCVPSMPRISPETLKMPKHSIPTAALPPCGKRMSL